MTDVACHRVEPILHARLLAFTRKGWRATWSSLAAPPSLRSCRRIAPVRGGLGSALLCAGQRALVCGLMCSSSWLAAMLNDAASRASRGRCCLVDPSMPRCPSTRSHSIKPYQLDTMQSHSTMAAITIPAGVAALYAIYSVRQAMRAQPSGLPLPRTHAEQASAAELQARQPRRCLTTYSVQLHHAVVSGDVATVQHILAVAPQAAAVRVNGSGDSLLHTAASQGSVEVMQLLVKAAPSALTEVKHDRGSALHAAARKGNDQAVHWLLQAAPQLAVMRDAWAGLPCMQRLPQHKDWQLCARWRKASQHWL